MHLSYFNNNLFIFCFCLIVNRIALLGMAEETKADMSVFSNELQQLKMEPRPWTQGTKNRIAICEDQLQTLLARTITINVISQSLDLSFTGN